jgi:Uma2 family endonuclease
MSATLTALSSTITPPPMRAVSAPPRKKPKWSVEEFHRVRATGIWEGLRTYLIHGEIWEQGPMNPPHAVLVGLVQDALRALFGAAYTVRAQVPVVLGDSSPFPDLAVVKGQPRDFLKAHPTTAELIVEVADSSLFEDTTTKAEVYATGGILDYWVLDVENRLLLVFRDPAALPKGGMAYRTCLKLKEDESVTPLAQPSAAIRVGDLLG